MAAASNSRLLCAVRALEIRASSALARRSFRGPPTLRSQALKEAAISARPLEERGLDRGRIAIPGIEPARPEDAIDKARLFRRRHGRWAVTERQGQR